MPFLRPLALIVALATTALPLACGGKSEPESASDISVPLDGRSVSRPNQLAGTWMAISDGPLAGIEFLKDAQAMLTPNNRSTTTVAYKVLDDGRLSLIAAQGATTNYKATLAGDTLELVPELTGAVMQRFEKVAAGKTLPEAIAAREAELLAQMEQRILNLRDTLLKANTVISSTEGDDRWVMAVTFDDPNSSLNGSMLLDTPIAGRNDSLNPVRVLPVRADTARADSRTNRIRIVMNVGPATEPSGQQDVSGQIVLTIDGPSDRPNIAGEATFPKLWPGPRPVALTTDAKAFAGATAKLEAQRAAIAAERSRMEAFLAGRVEFAGQRTDHRAGPVPVRVVVERNEQGAGYTAQITAPNRPEQQTPAAIDLVVGTAALYINTPWGEQWRLQTTAAADTLEGPWRPSARGAFLGHGSVSLTVERRWTEAQVAAERAATEVYLTRTLRSPQPFVGSIPVRYGTNTTYWPVAVELQTNADGTATGTAWLIAHRRGATLAGRNAGRTLDLTSNGVMEGSEQTRPDRHRWNLTLSGIDPEPIFTGQANAYTGGGVVALRPASEQGYRAAETAFVDALRGTTFAVVRTDSSTSRDENTFLRVADVSDDGTISGEILGDGPGMWSPFTPPALFNGVIENSRGVPVARVTVSPAPDPNYGGGRDGKPFELSFAPTFDPDGPMIAGWTNPERGNQDWFVLTPMAPVADIPMNPTQRIRLAALRLGATTQTPADPKPGDRVVVIVSVTERDQKIGQVFHADGRYVHQNSIPAAAIHAGLANPGEICILRLTYGPPLTAPSEQSERNGVTTQKVNFRENNTLPTFTLELLAAD